MVLFRAVFSADVEKSEKRGNIAILPQCLLEASSDLQHRDRMGKDSIPVFDGFQSYFMHLLVYVFEDSLFFLTFASLGQWWTHGLSSIVSEFAPTYASPMLLVSCALSVMYPLQSAPKSPFFLLRTFCFLTEEIYRGSYSRLLIITHCPSLILPQHYSLLCKRATRCWECRQTSDVHSDINLFSVLLFYSFLTHSNINFLPLSVDVFCLL